MLDVRGPLSAALSRALTLGAIGAASCAHSSSGYKVPAIDAPAPQTQPQVDPETGLPLPRPGTELFKPGISFGGPLPEFDLTPPTPQKNILRELRGATSYASQDKLIRDFGFENFRQLIISAPTAAEQQKLAGYFCTMLVRDALEMHTAPKILGARAEEAAIDAAYKKLKVMYEHTSRALDELSTLPPEAVNSQLSTAAQAHKEFWAAVENMYNAHQNTRLDPPFSAYSPFKSIAVLFLNAAGSLLTLRQRFPSVHLIPGEFRPFGPEQIAAIEETLTLAGEPALCQQLVLLRHEDEDAPDAASVLASTDTNNSLISLYPELQLQAYSDVRCGTKTVSCFTWTLLHEVGHLRSGPFFGHEEALKDLGWLALEDCLRPDPGDSIPDFSPPSLPDAKHLDRDSKFLSFLSEFKKFGFELDKVTSVRELDGQTEAEFILKHQRKGSRTLQALRIGNEWVLALSADSFSFAGAAGRFIDRKGVQRLLVRVPLPRAEVQYYGVREDAGFQLTINGVPWHYNYAGPMECVANFFAAATLDNKLGFLPGTPSPALARLGKKLSAQ